MRFKLNLLLFLSFILLSSSMIAQNVTGTVTDDTGPLPGVNVIVQGTESGTTTDFDGKYTIEAKNGDTLLFSYVGMESESVVVDTSIIDVALTSSENSLEEVVVVGYGVVKKKLATGANLNIKGDKIKELTPSSAIEALQGITPGVSITKNSGEPGAGTKVYIRGIGTIGNAAPLYIVDGVAVGNIDYLSPTDIASIDILKDAASSAIYGARAANGVILVTTKSGKKGSNLAITVDSYAGVKTIYKKPDLLNATEYAEIMNETHLNSSPTNTPYDFAALIPSWSAIENGWEGTDWFDEMTSTFAPVSNYSFNVTGGSDRIIYSMGASKYEEEGLVGRDIIGAGLKRLSLRLNTELALIQKEDYDVVTLGENLTYTGTTNKRVAAGNIYYNDLHNALVTSPFMPVYTDGEYTKAYDWYEGQGNPIAMMDYQRKNSWGKNNGIVGNFYIEIQPIRNLKFKSNYGLNTWFGNSRSYQPVHDLGGTVQSRGIDRVVQSAYQGLVWTWTNTLNYKRSFGNHNFTALLGQEQHEPKSTFNMEAEGEGTIFNEADRAYLNTIQQSSEPFRPEGSDLAAQGGGRLLSYFGRLSYNFDEKYLLTAVLRRDGSSNFHPDHRWATFPSVSAGWVISGEDFMSDSNTINYLKLRGSWGQNGNHTVVRADGGQEIFGYSSTIATNGFYHFGPGNSGTSNGSFPARLPTKKLTWETSEQTSLGLDARFFSSNLILSFDWYKKLTKDWLVPVPVLASTGHQFQLSNAGDIENKGMELSLGWNNREGYFKWGITANVAYNKNEVVKLGDGLSVINGPRDVLSQGTAEIFRAEVGHPLGYFYGFKTDGILQNQAEADAYPYFRDADPDDIAHPQPGDVRFVDTNGDGVIDNEDKVELGSPQPDYIFGLQLNANYKGFYANTTLTGQAGMQVMKSYRSFADQLKQNYTTEVLNRWHGEGTSTRLPELSDEESRIRNKNFISDIYMQDADFLRISNLTIGYDFTEVISNHKFISGLKLYGSVKNLHTFTKYDGLDPEVGYGPTSWSSGIDLGLYPSARTYLVGLNITL